MHTFLYTPTVFSKKKYNILIHLSQTLTISTSFLQRHHRPVSFCPSSDSPVPPSHFAFCFRVSTYLQHLCMHALPFIMHSLLLITLRQKKLFLKFEMSTKDRDFAIKQSYLLKNATLQHSNRYCE